MLNVYRASAGSGKTFTLAVEYIKLLIIDPNNYKYILAVTFTNKATAEMKTRILTELFGIANNLKSSEDYYQALLKTHSSTNPGEMIPGGEVVEAIEAYNNEREAKGMKKVELEKEIRARAKRALANIIHDYSRFRIETIDSFFQSILKQLARELDLTANLKVDLNDKEVLKDAVKEVINSLQLKENKNLLDWIAEFIQERIDDESNWKIEKNINKFGKNIFEEKFLKNSQKLSATLNNFNNLNTFKKKLYKDIEKLKKERQDLANDFLTICNDNNLGENDFYNASRGIYSFFDKIANNATAPKWSTTAENCLTNDDSWEGKKGKPDTHPHIECFKQILNKIKNTYTEIDNISAVTKNINELGMIGSIDKKVRELNTDADRFLLCETAYFLNRVIDNSDVPFIYEKSGSTFKYIMIDEFQDTSELQWENFIPLILNSLSSSCDCLIVGDVKQSIYRWRNSDWAILNNIETNKTFKSLVNNIPLKINYRSGGNIINFNNNFFKFATDKINSIYSSAFNGSQCEPLLKAYSDVEQLANAKKQGLGHIRIEALYDKDNNSKYKSDDKYIQDTIKQLYTTVQELKDKGISNNDITILVRKNKYIPIICEYFASQPKKIDIVSDEAFELKSSKAVCIIVDAIRHLAHPEDKMAKATLVVNYRRYVDRNESGQLPSEEELFNIFLKDEDNLDSFLPEDFTNDKENLTQMPIYSLAEKLYDIFSLSKIEKQSAYMFAFYDAIIEYLDNHPSDLENFIKSWDETISTHKISLGNAEGVRILSIHKSKGLEFKNVLIPFCDWKFYDNELIWVETDQLEDEYKNKFKDLPVLPINTQKGLENTCFKDEYFNELIKLWVDNINILYVGFTRAKYNLFVWCMANDSFLKKADIIPKSKDDQGLSLHFKCNDIINAWLENKLPIIEDSDNDVPDNTFYHNSSEGLVRYSENDIYIDSEHKEKTDNVLKESPQTIDSIYHYTDSIGKFIQSNESMMFINGNETESNNAFIDEGQLFHYILSLMNTPNDLKKAIRKAESKGLFVNEEHINSVEMQLKKAFNNTIAKTWFDTKWRTYNECDIRYFENGKPLNCRPDRVICDGETTIVVDYKTGKQNQEHIDQVKKYMTRLKEMNFPNIKGYIWYIRREENPIEVFL